jgi:hypothetical protein
MSTDRASATKRIAAPAAALFAIVSDPAGHVDIDGSGMLEAAPGSQRLASAGDTFEIHMDREPLGDLPIGKYQVLNTVTQLVPDRLVEWTVGNADRPSYGYVYGWQLDSVDDATTDVTNYCDWSAVSDERKARGSWPLIPVSTLERSVENLERIATSRH